jgi:2-succinyl-5-enolpyruvyl-6-hydroxy-3-cyclohexene-1-carboxylate synthase
MTEKHFENKNYAFAASFVDELARCGLKHVCICPGSRSSPLAISFARNLQIKKWVHLDERSASFFALGMAKTTHQPVALICSSGTATANFFPAIVEAHYSSVPLLILTADRPPELQGWGALQTIDQTRMYGSHVKWSASMPVPEAFPALLAFVRSTAARAVITAVENPAGPVHINFPFREPLEPVDVPSDFPDAEADLASPAYCGRPAQQPYLKVSDSANGLSTKNIRKLAGELKRNEKGLIICGPESGADLADSVAALSQKLGFPVLADCLSGIRCGPHDRRNIIDCYDAFISDKTLAKALAPEVVIRLGALPVSKPLVQYLELHPAARHILIDGGPGWRDPLHISCESWRVEPSWLCNELAQNLGTNSAPTPWQSLWMSLAAETRNTLNSQLNQEKGLFEGKVFTELSRLLPENSLVFSGNSMPVRDLDTFFQSTPKSLRFMANRGASGIDGVVSSALGAGSVFDGRLVLVLGDISFYHDMNGLLAARNFGLSATIIVINNNGGGIFSFLPQSAYPDVFETYFGTPHGLTFQSAAQLYGLGYCLAEDWPSFEKAVTASFANKGTTVIEVPGDRAVNVQLHQQIRDSVAKNILPLWKKKI